jgi:SAM-dependent methyltransferase
MPIIQSLVNDLSTFLGVAPESVLDKLEREIFNKGITVAEAWRAADPKTAEEVTAFYQTTDAYLYDLLVDHHGSFRRLVRDRILQRLAHQRAKRVLDYGGGVGLDAMAMCQAGMEVTYFELESVTSRFAAWMFARSGCRIEVISSPVAIASGAYDGAVCIEVLEHVPDPPAVIADLHRSLRLGGIALVSESFGDVGGLYPSHLPSNRRFAGRIGAMMEKHGFALTQRPPDEKPLEFVKMKGGAQFHYLQWKRRLEVGRDLVRRAFAYAGKLR